MKVSEIFRSIQGEGPRAGRQTIFIRLSGCNLNCTWCDTKYAQEEGLSMKPSEVVGRMESIGLSDIKDITFTGGEPLMQIGSILDIMELLPLGYHCNFETNGTIYFKFPYNPTIVISPKLSNSGNPCPEFDSEWALNSRIPGQDIWYKFVVETQIDVEEVIHFIGLYKIPKSQVFFMPQCITADRHMELWESVFKWSLENGVNASPRLQTLAFNNKRGV